MEDIKKPKNIIEEILELLDHSMKALDEVRGKTLIYSKYRDTQAVSDRIYDLTQRIRKRGKDGFELAEVWVDREKEQEKQKPLIREIV